MKQRPMKEQPRCDGRIGLAAAGKLGVRVKNGGIFRPEALSLRAAGVENREPCRAGPFPELQPHPAAVFRQTPR